MDNIAGRAPGNGAAESPAEGVGRARDEVSGAADDVKNATHEASHRLKEAGASAVKGVAGKVKDEVDHRKELASGSMDRIASKIEKTASDIDEEDGWARDLLTKGASSLKKASAYLSSARIEDTLHSIESYARRKPAVFVGASIAVGFLISRLAKVATERAQELSSDEPDSGGGYQDEFSYSNANVS